MDSAFTSKIDRHLQIINTCLKTGPSNAFKQIAKTAWQALERDLAAGEPLKGAGALSLLHTAAKVGHQLGLEVKMVALPQGAYGEGLGGMTFTISTRSSEDQAKYLLQRYWECDGKPDFFDEQTLPDVVAAAKAIDDARFLEAEHLEKLLHEVYGPCFRCYQNREGRHVVHIQSLFDRDKLSALYGTLSLVRGPLIVTLEGGEGCDWKRRLEVLKDSKVKSLKVEGALDDSGAAQLALFLERHGCLEELYLPWTSLSEKGARKLFSALRPNETLRRLSLGGNELSDRAVSWLAINLVDSQLEVLELWCCGITDQGASSLEEASKLCPTLKILDRRLN